MIVLGISPLDKDSTVSLVKDGKVLFAAAEERFTRVKLQDGFPTKALENALAYTGVRIEDIDVVAYPFFDYKTETELFSKNLREEKQLLGRSKDQRHKAKNRGCLGKNSAPGAGDSRARRSQREDE